MQAPNVRLVTVRDHDCLYKPDFYKLCSQGTCVPATEPCPCAWNEFQCNNRECISVKLVCDGTKHCSLGEDEQCADLPEVRSGLSVSIVATIISTSCFIVLVGIVFIVLYIMRRRRNAITKESQLVQEPLQTEKRSDTYKSEKEADKNYKSRHKQICDKNSDKTSNPRDIHAKDFQNSSSKLNTELESLVPKHRMPNSPILDTDQNYINERPTHIEKSLDNTNFKSNFKLCSKNLTLSIKENDVNVSHNEDVSNSKMSPTCESHNKVGVYTFVPRTNSSRVTKLYHSFIPSHTEPTTPESLDFDRERIPYLFAHELLCASTPKQPVKQLIFYESEEIAFIDE